MTAQTIVVPCQHTSADNRPNFASLL